MAKTTRLRSISSKDRRLMEAFIERLPFKIEIKGNPVREKNKWVIFFVLPEDENPIINKFVSIDLD